VSEENACKITALEFVMKKGSSDAYPPASSSRTEAEEKNAR